MTSSHELVEETLAHIADRDQHTNAVCTLNPAAARVAQQRDEESSAGRSRGPLHGRPVLVKDNIDTADMLTTAGSLALADRPPLADATLVTRLREAGMVIVGKTNLSEWANIRDEASTSGWSAYGGLTRNPYGLNRSAGGSSSGSGAAVAAGLAPYALGTETDGSITSPAAFNGCVGIKPTVGLLPTRGIVPVSASQDTAGPMALTVREAAALLSVLVGDGRDYAGHAVEPRLAGKRIGIPRRLYWGYSALADGAAERAIASLASAGASIIDHTDLRSMEGYGAEDELLVMLAELRAGLGEYLASRPDGSPRSLADVVKFNRAHADVELEHFGQSLFEKALDGPEVGSPEYLAAREACLLHARQGIDKVLDVHDLDALLTPSYPPAIPIDLVNAENHWGSCTQPAAMAGYPLLTVPSGLAHGLPVAVSFWGASSAEATLIEIAHGYELARDHSDGPLPEPTFPAFV